MEKNPPLPLGSMNMVNVGGISGSDTGEIGVALQQARDKIASNNPDDAKRILMATISRCANGHIQNVSPRAYAEAHRVLASLYMWDDRLSDAYDLVQKGIGCLHQNDAYCEEAYELWMHGGRILKSHHQLDDCLKMFNTALAIAKTVFGDVAEKTAGKWGI